MFRPGVGGYTLFADERPSHTRRWSIKAPVRVRAMAIAGKTLFAAGTPDVVPKDDPWAAIDGRKGGELWVVSTATGERIGRHKLESPPVYDGMAAADGRLFISTTDGRVVCFQGK